MKFLQFYIDGKWIDPVKPETIDVINPATEEPTGQISMGSAADVDLAVAAAKKTFPSYSRFSVKERVELLTSVREEYKRRYDDVAHAIMIEMGAPINLAKGGQASVGLGHLKTAIRVLSEFTFEYPHGNYTIRREPIGVCGLITPWNWPINQVMAKLAPCLASGCTSVLKPSEVAPLSTMLMAEICHTAGVPAGVLNVINGFGPIVGEAMSAHPDIALMSFTGSTRGGIAVAKTSAETVKRVAQELGGKSANIILDDDAMAETVARGVTGVMDNTGQSCNAPTRMLVPASRHEEALAVAKATAEKVVVGDPASESTDMGPLVSDVQFNKVQDLIQKGIDEGATLVTGGTGRPDGINRGYFVRPTVFGNVNNDMTIARDEIFGPVLSILSYDNRDDAIAIANDTDYGLAAYVSGDPANIDQLMDYARELHAGQVHINYTGGGTDAPFGGYKQSGNGREKAEWGFEEYLETKAILGGAQ